MQDEQVINTMNREFSGKSTCLIHGEFEWFGIFQERNTVISFEGRKKINCEHIYRKGQSIIAETSCPVCYRIKELIVENID